MANAFRAPSNQMFSGSNNNNNMYPQHYNPPYGGSVPNLEYGSGPNAYAPPPGPPPQFAHGYSAEDLGKPPGYEGGAGAYGNDKDLKDHDHDDSKEDPFADFEGASRDVTSRPRPGEHDTFHV